MKARLWGYESNTSTSSRQRENEKQEAAISALQKQEETQRDEEYPANSESNERKEQKWKKAHMSAHLHTHNHPTTYNIKKLPRFQSLTTWESLLHKHTKQQLYTSHSTSTYPPTTVVCTQASNSDTIFPISISKNSVSSNPSRKVTTSGLFLSFSYFAHSLGNGASFGFA